MGRTSLSTCIFQNRWSTKTSVAKEKTWTDEFMQQCTFHERQDFEAQYSSLAPFGRFYAFPGRGRQGPEAPAELVPNEEVEFLVVSANTEVFNIKFMDQNWPVDLPPFGNSAKARKICLDSMKHIRHNRSQGISSLQRDSGGWIKIHDLLNFFSGRDMVPITEYVNKHKPRFGNPCAAAIGAYIACFCFRRKWKPNLNLDGSSVNRKGRRIRRS